MKTYYTDNKCCKFYHNLKYQNRHEASSRSRILLISLVYMCVYVCICLFIYLCHASWPNEKRYRPERKEFLNYLSKRKNGETKPAVWRPYWFLANNANCHDVPAWHPRIVIWRPFGTQITKNTAGVVFRGDYPCTCTKWLIKLPMLN